MAKRKSTATDFTIPQWLLLGFAVLFFFVTPFEVALFNGRELAFERPIYMFQVWGAIALLLLSLHWFFRWKLEEHRDLAVLAVWLIPLSYAVSLFFAASMHHASDMVYISLMYVVAFFSGLVLAGNETIAHFMQRAFLVSAYVVVLFGFMNWFGQADFHDAVQQNDAGNRLASVFQYANTYAAFLIAALLGSLFLSVFIKSKREKLFHTFFLVPIFVSLFLTLSRGGLLILPFVFWCVLLFFPLKRQIVYIVHTVFALLGTLIILNPVTSAGLQLQKEYSGSLAWQGWGILIAASGIVTLFVYLFDRFLWQKWEQRLDRWNRLRLANAALPAFAVVVAIAAFVLLFGTSWFQSILPADVAKRIENINFQQHSVLERATLYRDSFKLIQDYPLFGAGGGAWQTLYFKYQNNPYTVNQAHNFFLQYLIEVGIFGFIVLLFVLGYVFFIYIRRYFRSPEESRTHYFVFFIAAFSILAHSIIDFDMSYVYLATLVFFCLGAMTASAQTPKLSFTAKFNISRWRWFYPVTCAVVAVFVAFQSIQFVIANNRLLDALRVAKQGAVLADVLKPLDQAIKLHPLHPEYKFQKIAFLKQAYQQTKNEKFYLQAQELIEQIRNREPHSVQLYLVEYDLYTLKGEWEKALSVANKAKNEYPWFLDPYEKSLVLQFNLGEQARQNRKTDEMNRYWDGALNVYEEVVSKMKQLENLPEGQLQGREFNVTPSMSFALGKIHYLRGDIQGAVPLLKAGFRPQLDTEQDQQAALWYLAALRKTNQNDPAVYDALKKADPETDSKIEKLARIP